MIARKTGKEYGIAEFLEAIMPAML